MEQMAESILNKMKKYSLFLMAAMALGFAACDDKSDLGIAQVNEQEPVVEANGLVFQASEAYTSLINLDVNQGKNVNIATVVSSELPEDAEVVCQLYVSKEESMANAEIIPLQNGAVEADVLEDVISQMYGISPEEVSPWMGIAAYAQIGTQNSRLGGDSFYYLKQQVKVLPVDLRLDIEASYNLCGTINQAMDHSSTHQYIDNNFVAIFEVTADQAAAGFKWYIAPGSLGANPNPALCFGPGVGEDLALGAQGTITTPGRYRLVADMLKKTYTLTFAYEVLYTPGSGNGWSQENSMRLYTNNYSLYYGFTRTGEEGAAKGEFKLDATTNWSMNWGLDNGVLTPNGPNIVTEPAGFYFVKADLNGLWIWTFRTEKIGVIGLNGNWNDDIFMTPSSDMLTWTAEITATDNTEFKFRVNSDWGANFGGDKDALSLDGNNISIGAGTYVVTLDLSKVPYSCKIESK